jgi:uncharacterized protein YegL
MEQHEKLLNDTIEHVFTTVGDSPQVAEFAHISIITFSTDAHLVLEMSDIETVDQLPMIGCHGSTSYGKMFKLVRQRIDADVERLARNAGRAVLRPAVFILTDGEPTDKEWSSAFGALIDPGWRRRPHIISYGFGAANEAVLGRIATKAAFLANQVDSEKEAIVSMLTSLLKTLVHSASAQELKIPVDVPGYKSIPIEFVD